MTTKNDIRLSVLCEADKSDPFNQKAIVKIMVEGQVYRGDCESKDHQPWSVSNAIATAGAEAVRALVDDLRGK